MNEQKGFTVPELIIVAVLTAVLSSLLLMITINFWQMGYKTQADSEAFVERLNASDYFREVLGTASGLINQNSIPDTTVPASVQDAGEGPQYWQLIHAEPGLKGSSTTITPLIYFRRPSMDASKNLIMNGLYPYEDEYIVYHDGPNQQLKVRTLANSAAPGNSTQTTCTTETPTCRADRILINHITSVELIYFSRSGNLIDYTPSPPSYDTDGNLVNGPDFPAVEVVELKLRIQRGSAFNSTTSTRSATIIRIALRNS